MVVIASKDNMVVTNAALSPAGLVNDDYDVVRQSAAAILQRLPGPLPGFGRPQEVGQLMAWAQSLLCSSRVRQADAGESALCQTQRAFRPWMCAQAVQPVCLQT